MIYVRLAGGLGNQLYQMAAAASLFDQFGGEVRVFTKSLSRYGVPRRPDFINILSAGGFFDICDYKKNFIAYLMSVELRIGKFPTWVSVNDRNFHDTIHLNPRNFPIFLDGYFQRGWSQRQFDRALQLMKINIMDVNGGDHLSNNSALIHIRGGDFLNIPRYKVVGPKFYAECIRCAMAEGFGRFAIMTDDLTYAKVVCGAIEILCPSAELYFLPSGRSALEDFYTLRAAKARIIGNSTFAWWAAALGASDAPTWSPNAFIVEEKRDFFLPNEIVIENA